MSKIAEPGFPAKVGGARRLGSRFTMFSYNIADIPAQRAPHADRASFFIHCRMSRNGHILESSIIRPSGFPLLDPAALETLRRADPLPKIPLGHLRFAISRLLD